MCKYVAKPFLKWAGGKGQLLDTFDKMFKTLYILEKDSNFFNKINKHVALFINWSDKTTYEVIDE